MAFSQTDPKKNPNNPKPNNRGLGFVQLGVTSGERVFLMNDPVDYSKKLERNQEWVGRNRHLMHYPREESTFEYMPSEYNMIGGKFSEYFTSKIVRDYITLGNPIVEMKEFRTAAEFMSK